MKIENFLERAYLPSETDTTPWISQILKWHNAWAHPRSENPGYAYAISDIAEDAWLSNTDELRSSSVEA